MYFVFKDDEEAKLAQVQQTVAKQYQKPVVCRPSIGYSYGGELESLIVWNPLALKAATT